MSRNLTVQLVIAGLLVALVLAAGIILVQFNSIEDDLLEIKQKTAHTESVLTQLNEKIDRGIKVSGNAAGSNNTSAGSPGGVANIPGNILTPEPLPLVAPGAVSGGHLRLASGSDFKGFNRLVENGADVQELYLNFLGNNLARRQIEDPNKWAPDLAEAVVLEDDAKTVHVYLRKGVYWHKAAVDFSNPRYKWLDKDHEVVADDFEFMVQMLLDPKVEGAAPLRTYFEDFDRFERVNDYEFKLIWKKKTVGTIANSLDNIIPLPRWIYGFDEEGNAYPDAILGLKFNAHWYNDRAIGTGPWRFVESKPGEFLKMTRNEAYFEGPAAIKDVTMSIVKDNELRLLQFKRGDIDVTGLSPTQYRKEILDAPQSPFKTGQFEYKTYTRLVYYYLGWNGDGVFMSDKLVRQAMTRSLNRERIIKEVFVGLGNVTTGPFHPSTPFYDTTIQPWAFDLEAAGKLLDEAGWKDTDADGIRDKVVKGEKKKFEFNFLIYNSSPEYKTMADIYKEDLIKIGVRMNVQPVDWPTMQKKMDDKEFDGFSGGWGLDWESDPYQLWHSTQADIPKGSNRVGFRNPEADKIIIDARTTFDEAKRTEMFKRFHAILHDEQPYTFFYVPEGVLTWNPRVKNVIIQKVRPQVVYQRMYLQDGK